jgi:poly-gamma-glutamate synthesis protein (capsule biosynthesis protein)
MSSQNSLQLTVAGDAMITRRISHREGEDAFDELVETVRSADVGILNLETLLHDYEGYPAAQQPGIAMRAPPWAADELTWVGFDVFTAATNHAIDYSHGGMETTMDHLEERNVPYAGLGRTLADARAPAYIDTPSGRVATVSACSTVTTGSEAGEQRPDAKGRPGIAPIRLSTRYLLPEDVHDVFVEASEALGLEELKRHQRDIGFPIVKGDEFNFVVVGGDTHPVIGVGDEYAVRRDPDRNDIKAILRQIRAATRQADWVVASLHAHEGEGARSTEETVAPFIETFARECVDAGADAFIGHGSHCLSGIELYDGAPVFYSLGNFIAQNETTDRLPADVYSAYGLDRDALPADFFDWRYGHDNGDRSGFRSDRIYYESVLPVCEYEEGTLVGLELYPIELNLEGSRSRRGTPVIADSGTADRILERLAGLSDPYGTELAVEDGVATVDLSE